METSNKEPLTHTGYVRVILQILKIHMRYVNRVNRTYHKSQGLQENEVVLRTVKPIHS